MQRSCQPSGLYLLRLKSRDRLSTNQQENNKNNNGMFLKLNGRIAERQYKLYLIVERSRLVWPSCSGLCWAVFWGTLGWVTVDGGRTFAEFRELLFGLTSEDGQCCVFYNSLVEACFGAPYHRFSGLLLLSRSKGWVSADCVRGDRRSTTWYHSTIVKFGVVIIVSCRAREWGSRRAVSSGSSEELRHLKSSCFVRNL